MLRALLVLSVTFVGIAIGTLIALIGVAAFLEFGNSGCTGAACTQPFVRTFLGIGALAGGLLGFGKGLNIIAPPKLGM